MILILTNDVLDSSVSRVIDWLHFFNKRYIKLTLNSLLNGDVIFDLPTIKIKSKSKVYSVEDITCIWCFSCSNNWKTTILLNCHGCFLLDSFCYYLC